MELLDIASDASRWCGYDYYRGKKVRSLCQTGENVYEGTVDGSSEEPYTVAIDILYPEKSTCSCPFAEGTKTVCKHKVALYFAAFPEEAKRYFAEVEQAEREAEEYNERLYERVEQTIRKMKKSELQHALMEVLNECPERVLDLFVRNYLE